MRTIEGPYLTVEENQYLEKLLCDTVEGVRHARIDYAISGVGEITIDGPAWWRFLYRHRTKAQARTQLRYYGPRGCRWTISWG